MTLGALGARLSPRAPARSPSIPSGGEARTIGGVLACNASGPLRFRYGTGRDLLLGVRFVQADGTITWGGAKVVKSVTGYDVPKLLVGSLGTLGVIVEATLRLHPLPPVERVLALRLRREPARRRTFSPRSSRHLSSPSASACSTLRAARRMRSAERRARRSSCRSRATSEAVAAQGEALAEHGPPCRRPRRAARCGRVDEAPHAARRSRRAEAGRRAAPDHRLARPRGVAGARRRPSRSRPWGRRAMACSIWRCTA